jgi:hypothetical protein
MVVPHDSYLGTGNVNCGIEGDPSGGCTQTGQPFARRSALAGFCTPDRAPFNAQFAVRRPRPYAVTTMCRNIRTLHNFEPPATREEIHASALQYVRKISGSTKPSKANEAAFARALEAVEQATAQLLDELVSAAPPKDREVEAAKARARSAERYAA